MTACAPNTYHRPQLASTGASAASNSTAAGWTGTAEKRGEADMEVEILAPERIVRPWRIAGERLPAQLFPDAQAFEGPEAGDALGPVRVLAQSRCRPVARHELANATGNHGWI